ncbi:ficolin-2-like isoform X1 [Acropora millepora]|uniref:ficolin-2-like isoform X1 n=1 Tax=Acropora millepora TaxID=45264 RepID=UPI001CF1CDB2|nr:ficolin-2-like isoform X1 [Acropora millepora]
MLLLLAEDRPKLAGAVFKTTCNMETFNLLVIFKQLLLLILLSLAHADKETSVDETAAAISRKAIPQKFEFVNFKEDKFSFLNITALVKRVVADILSCAFSCLDNLACFSFNVAAFPDKAGKFTCEILSSDKYNNSEGFLPSKTFHHFSIVSACESKSFPCGEKEICIPDYHRNSFKCKCQSGYTGSPCEPKSCFQVLQSGNNSTGVYRINPDGSKPITVSCDMTTDGGGWTVFQRRVDSSTDFYRGWTDYKSGFGNLSSEFWLGNDNLHRIAAAGNLTLRVDLEDFERNVTFAEYSIFKVADASDKYRLLIGGYNGTAGDSMAFQNGMQFSTKDQKNDPWNSSCAVKYKGAWWYKTCHTSNLNGQYLGGHHDTFADGINWKAFRGFYYSLKRSEMKLRPQQ